MGDNAAHAEWLRAVVLSVGRPTEAGPGGSSGRLLEVRFVSLNYFRGKLAERSRVRYRLRQCLSHVFNCFSFVEAVFPNAKRTDGVLEMSEGYFRGGGGDATTRNRTEPVPNGRPADRRLFVPRNGGRTTNPPHFRPRRCVRKETGDFGEDKRTVRTYDPVELLSRRDGTRFRGERSAVRRPQRASGPRRSVVRRVRSGRRDRGISRRNRYGRESNRGRCHPTPVRAVGSFSASRAAGEVRARPRRAHRSGRRSGRVRRCPTPHLSPPRPDRTPRGRPGPRRS